MIKINIFRILACFTFLTLPAHAGIIKLDWQNNGDQQILRDTDTNVDWLHLSQTKGLSYSEVLNKLEVGGDFYGFKVAKLDDIVKFFSSYGLQLDNPSINSGHFLSGIDIVTLQTIVNDTGISFYSYYDHIFSFPNLGTLVKSTGLSSDFNGQGYVSFGSGWMIEESSFNVSTWLIKDAKKVPEPNSVWLLSIALIGFARFKKN